MEREREREREREKNWKTHKAKANREVHNHKLIQANLFINEPIKQFHVLKPSNDQENTRHSTKSHSLSGTAQFGDPLVERQ